MKSKKIILLAVGIVTLYSMLFSMNANVMAQKPADAKKEADINEVPFLSTYYIAPVVSPDENIVIKYYVTDWNQTEYRFGNSNFTFTVTLEYGLTDKPEKDMRKIEKKSVKPGDNSIELGKLAPGEYVASLQAVDQFGRKSPVLFNEFLVRDQAKSAITQAETYIMTEKDLFAYNISNRGDYGKLELVGYDKESGGKPADVIESKAASVKPAQDRYIIVATGKDGIPDNGNWKNCKVIYGEKYDKAKVEEEAVRTVDGINKLLAECSQKGMKKLVMLPGTYRISNTKTIEVPSGCTLDLNGATIKLNEFTGCSAMMIRIRDGIDSHVINGTVEGDYFEHDYKNSEKNSEWVCGVDISGGSKYSSIENLNIRYITGYGASNGFHDNYAYPIGIGGNKFKSGDISTKDGLDTPCPSRCSSDFIDISRFIPFKYLAFSLYLGYQGMATDSWNYVAHFYTKDKTYIKSIDAFQYRIIRIPENAVNMRLSVIASDPASLKGSMTVNSFKIPWNCSFKNLKLTLVRCVGMAQSAMRNFLVEGCEFTRCGESGAFCAYDAEDGWDMMQDLTFRKNKFYGNFRNDFLTCAGHNFIIEENEGRIHLWDRTKNYVVRNNKFSDAFFGSGFRNRTLLPRIYDNTFSGNVSIGGDNKKDGWTIVMKGPVNAQSITCGKGGVIADSEFKDMKMGTVNAYNCTLDNIDLNFGGSTFTKSKLKNVRGHSNGDVTIDDCQIEDITTAVFNPGVINISDSKLKNVQFSYAYWTKPGTIQIEKCTVENAEKALIHTPVYSVKDFKILNSQINTGSAPVMDIYDMRPQNTDNEPGTITFIGNKLDNDKKLVIGTGRGDSAKELIFINDKNQLMRGTVFINRDGAPAKWKIGNDPKKLAPLAEKTPEKKAPEKKNPDKKAGKK